MLNHDCPSALRPSEQILLDQGKNACKLGQFGEGKNTRARAGSGANISPLSDARAMKAYLARAGIRHSCSDLTRKHNRAGW